MKKLGLLVLGILFSLQSFAQNSPKAKQLLDEVSTKMSAYNNMQIEFTSLLRNEVAGLTNEQPILGKITIAGEKYNLNYLGNNFIFDGKTLAVVNTEEKEVTINSGDLEEDDGFIYPSKLLTFYKEGYNYKMGKLTAVKGRKIQFVELFPIDSNSDIKKVLLGIDAKTKHIFSLNQQGSNGAETIFTITKFKQNVAVSSSFFSFDKEKYEKMGYFVD